MCNAIDITQRIRPRNSLNMMFIGAAGVVFTAGEAMELKREFVVKDIVSQNKGWGKMSDALYIRSKVSPCF